MIVTGCEDCPLAHLRRRWRETYRECGHPAVVDDERDVYDMTTPPDWCPLRKEPLTIALEVRE